MKILVTGTAGFIGYLKHARLKELGMKGIGTSVPTAVAFVPFSAQTEVWVPKKQRHYVSRFVYGENK